MCAKSWKICAQAPFAPIVQAILERFWFLPLVQEANGGIRASWFSFWHCWEHWTTISKWMSDELFFDIISSSWSGQYVQKLLSPLRSYMYALFFAPGDKSDSQTFIAFAFVNCWPVWLIGDDAKRTTSSQNIYSYERYVPNQTCVERNYSFFENICVCLSQIWDEDNRKIFQLKLAEKNFQPISHGNGAHCNCRAGFDQERASDDMFCPQTNLAPKISSNLWTLLHQISFSQLHLGPIKCKVASLQ